jgi:type II secretory pathway pseudopilin PulG
MKRGPNGLEMLVSIVVIAILVFSLTARYTNAKRTAHLTQMMAELKDLVAAQEAYYLTTSDSEAGGRYAEALEHIRFVPHEQVVIALRADAWGWTGRVHSTELPADDYYCSIFVGRIKAYPPAVDEGIMACESPE